MEMKRCAKGHFFDANKYKVCPYCANYEDEMDKTVAILPTEIEKIDGTISLEEERNITFGQELGTYSGGDYTLTAGLDLDDIFEAKEKSQEVSKIEDDFTLPLSEDGMDGIYETEEEDEGKTVGIFSTTKVVGWLVCVKGEEKGKDFVLGSGRNFIGRSPSMDVSLPNDVTVSRENHAVITYNPRGNSFSISYGTGHGIVYVNGQEILNPIQLEPYDQIEVGETVLIFIPFCSEAFQWEEKK